MNRRQHRRYVGMQIGYSPVIGNAAFIGETVLQYQNWWIVKFRRDLI